MLSETENVKQDSDLCPFCNLKVNGTTIIESNNGAFAIYDRYPVNPGHTLIIPGRHCADYFMLSPDEQSACWELVNRVRDIIDQRYHPDGYNIGINNLDAAGQTVPHVHIHLIPRYTGDVPRPQGGIRGVIPDRKEY
jgi:diadenosine tetraphosphate (Ap4A) HIT family hydrolase